MWLANPVPEPSTLLLPPESLIGFGFDDLQQVGYRRCRFPEAYSVPLLPQLPGDEGEERVHAGSPVSSEHGP